LVKAKLRSFKLEANQSWKVQRKKRQPKKLELARMSAIGP